MNHNLLLSERSEIDAKPELEIYADDVACSHGSTTGAIDQDQLFYMQARGVPRATAQARVGRAGPHAGPGPDLVLLLLPRRDSMARRRPRRPRIR